MHIVFCNAYISRRTIGPVAAERWTFLTNYGHVLLCIAADPEIRVRDIAEKVGITERAAQRIVADLIAAGYVESTRNGRRNHYRVNASLPMRHPIEEQSRIASLLALIKPAKQHSRGS
jgi:hypothetical protein